MSEQWLEGRAPGLRDLPDADRRAIFDFAFLWSLFEAQVMGNFARADRIRQKVDAWSQAGMLEAELYDAELGYFRNRYFADSALTHHFPFLALRPSDRPDLVQAVIEGANDDPRDRMLALLMIVWRLRNNLFHGAKWAYGLHDQRENFTHANSVLMRLLERHADPGSRKSGSTIFGDSLSPASRTRASARSTECLLHQRWNQMIKFSRNLNLTGLNSAGLLLKPVEPELRVQ